MEIILNPNNNFLNTFLYKLLLISYVKGYENLE